MEALKDIDPMTWMILIAAVVISVAALFNKAIKTIMKLAIIAVMVLFAVYFLVQAGVISSPGQ